MHRSVFLAILRSILLAAWIASQIIPTGWMVAVSAVVVAASETDDNVDDDVDNDDDECADVDTSMDIATTAPVTTNDANSNANINSNSNSKHLSRLFRFRPPTQNQNHHKPFFSLFWGGDREPNPLVAQYGDPAIGREEDEEKDADADANANANADDDFREDRDRIRKVLQKFYRLADPRFARASLAKNKQKSQLLPPPVNELAAAKKGYDDTDDEHECECEYDDTDDEMERKDDETAIETRDELRPGTVLEILDENNSDSDSDSETIPEKGLAYELVEKIHRELGEVPKHYMDFAYTSVMVGSTHPSATMEGTTTTDVEPIHALAPIHERSLGDDNDLAATPTTCKAVVSAEASSVGFVPATTTTSGSANPSAGSGINVHGGSDENVEQAGDWSTAFFSTWWRWWLPFSNSDWWKNYGSTKEDFEMDPTAFAGGSNGEVWRGRRICRGNRKSRRGHEHGCGHGPGDGTSAADRTQHKHQHQHQHQHHHQHAFVNPKWKETTEECSSSVNEEDSFGFGTTSDETEDSGEHETECDDKTPLVLKRLRIERGYLLLEAGLREIYFGKLVSRVIEESKRDMYTVYVDHFFREVPRNVKRAFGGLPTHHESKHFGHGPYHQQRKYDLELWIVFEDAGPSLRSYMYTPVESASDGGFVMHQHSKLWTILRTSTNAEAAKHSKGARHGDDSSSLEVRNTDELPRGRARDKTKQQRNKKIGQTFMQKTLREILQAAAELHKRGIVHRDIKPSNVMCRSDKPLSDKLLELESILPSIHCRLGDFSSGWDRYTSENLYTKGPTPGEQTDEYAPPESFVGPYWKPFDEDKPHSYDSWSIGVLALELLLGTPHVFSVDQRTSALLTNQMKRAGASDDEMAYALFLAALSNFCIFVPSTDSSGANTSWPLGHGDPLHKTSMVTGSCTLQDFHRALRARDPLGIGFDSSTDLLLHLIWQLLAYDPSERITAEEALEHPYFISPDGTLESLNKIPGFHNALESQMLDPRMDFDAEDEVNEFRCPSCGRVFHDWRSCHQHANLRKHAKFCVYDHAALPSCINTHSMLPEHATSGWCDLQGRRPTIEDFHSIHLHQDHQFYGIFDGHTGNLASKFVTSQLYTELLNHLPNFTQMTEHGTDESRNAWKDGIKTNVTRAFEVVHDRFLDRITTMTSPIVEVGSAPKMDQSGTTATAMLVTDHVVIVAVLGDSRGVLASAKGGNFSEDPGSSRKSSKGHWEDVPEVSAIPFSIDHVASNPIERDLVIQRGGFVSKSGGTARVNGTLAITRSIGDANLAPVLSREPTVLAFDRSEIKEMCGDLGQPSKRIGKPSIPCFVILASDGLWDVMTNQEAVDMVVDFFLQRNEASNASGATGREITVFSYGNEKYSYEGNGGAFQESAERLAVEAYVRGSTDNIGVCVVAIE